VGGSEERHAAASIEKLDKHTCNRRGLLVTLISKQELRINFQSCEERELFCYLCLLLNPVLSLGFESISRENIRGHLVFDVALINRSGVHKPRRLTIDIANGVLERSDFAANASTVKKLMIRNMELEENLAEKDRLWLNYTHNGGAKSTNVNFPSCSLRQEFIALFKEVKRRTSKSAGVADGDLPPPPPPEESDSPKTKPGQAVAYVKGQKTRPKAESVHLAPPSALKGWAPPPPPPPKGGGLGKVAEDSAQTSFTPPPRGGGLTSPKIALTKSQTMKVAAMKDALAPVDEDEGDAGRKGTGKGKKMKLSKEAEEAMDMHHLEKQISSGELGDLGLSVFVGTWNVGDRPPPKNNIDLRHWLGRAPNLSRAGWSGKDEQHSVPDEETAGKPVEEEPIRMSELLQARDAPPPPPEMMASPPPPPPTSDKTSRSGTRSKSAAKSEKPKVEHNHEHDIYAIGFQENSHKDAWVRAIAEYLGAAPHSHRTYKTPRQRAGGATKGDRSDSNIAGNDDDDFDDEGGGMAVGATDSGDGKDGDEYVLLSVVSLWGIGLVLAVRRELRDRISGLQVSTEATGLMHVLGNKGAAAVGFCIDDTTTVAFVTCHLAARATRVRQRAENYSEITAGLNLKQHKHLNSTGTAGVGTACKVDFLQHFHHVFWSGDLNYRIDLGNMGTSKEFKHVVKTSKAAMHDKVSMPGKPSAVAMAESALTRTVRSVTMAEKDAILLPLLQACQLRNEMLAQRTFIGFEEPPIHFPPTYRMIKGEHEYSNKKNQNPSYCDRVLCRSNRHGPSTVLPTGYAGVFELNNSDHRAVAAQYQLRLIAPAPCTTTGILQESSHSAALTKTPSGPRHVGGGKQSGTFVQGDNEVKYGVNSEAGYGRVFLPSLKLKVVKEVLMKTPKKDKKDSKKSEEEEEEALLQALEVIHLHQNIRHRHWLTRITPYCPSHPNQTNKLNTTITARTGIRLTHPPTYPLTLSLTHPPTHPLSHQAAEAAAAEEAEACRLSLQSLMDDDEEEEEEVEEEGKKKKKKKKKKDKKDKKKKKKKKDINLDLFGGSKKVKVIDEFMMHGLPMWVSVHAGFTSDTPERVSDSRLKTGAGMGGGGDSTENIFGTRVPKHTDVTNVPGAGAENDVSKGDAVGRSPSPSAAAAPSGAAAAAAKVERRTEFEWTWEDKLPAAPHICPPHLNGRSKQGIEWLGDQYVILAVHMAYDPTKGKQDRSASIASSRGGDEDDGMLDDEGGLDTSSSVSSTVYGYARVLLRSVCSNPGRGVRFSEPLLRFGQKVGELSGFLLLENLCCLLPLCHPHPSLNHNAKKGGSMVDTGDGLDFLLEAAAMPAALQSEHQQQMVALASAEAESELVRVRAWRAFMWTGRDKMKAGDMMDTKALKKAKKLKKGHTAVRRNKALGGASKLVLHDTLRNGSGQSQNVMHRLAQQQRASDMKLMLRQGVSHQPLLLSEANLSKTKFAKKKHSMSDGSGHKLSHSAGKILAQIGEFVAEDDGREFVTAMNQRWEADMFVCCYGEGEEEEMNADEADEDGQCGAPLCSYEDDHTEWYSVDEAEDAKLYCKRHFPMVYNAREGEDGRQICAGCMTPFQEGDHQLTALGRQWHADCFECSHCAQRISLRDQFFQVDGHPYCKADFISLFHSCASCGDPVPLEMDDPDPNSPEGAVKALDRIWHHKCFVCVECGVSFQTSHGEENEEDEEAAEKAAANRYYARDQHDGRGKLPYCKDHFMSNFIPTCKECHDYVLDGGVQLGDNPNIRVHRDCLKCADPSCGIKLNPELAIEKLEEAVLATTNAVIEKTNALMELRADASWMKQTPSQLAAAAAAKAKAERELAAAKAKEERELAASKAKEERAVMVYEEDTYCPQHYYELFGSVCAACHKVIQADEMEVFIMEQTFHAQCFKCELCPHPFMHKEGGEQEEDKDDEDDDAIPQLQFFPHDLKPYCRMHYIDNFCECCAGCSEPLVPIHTGGASGGPNAAGNKAGSREMVVLRALGSGWHQQCLCCTVCAKPLGSHEDAETDEDEDEDANGDSYVYSNEGRPYCHEHYNEFIAARCAGCHEPIDADGGKIIKTNQSDGAENEYHPRCFSCTKCGVGLGEGQQYYMQDDHRHGSDFKQLGAPDEAGKERAVEKVRYEEGTVEKVPYCEDDFFDLFGRHCAGCSLAIHLKDDVSELPAIGKVYHSTCLKCTHCGDALTEGKEICCRDKLPYCMTHYRSLFFDRCAHCNDYIVGAHQKALGKKWHSGHVRCFECGKDFPDGKVFVRSGIGVLAALEKWPSCAAHSHMPFDMLSKEGQAKISKAWDGSAQVESRTSAKPSSPLSDGGVEGASDDETAGSGHEEEDEEEDGGNGMGAKSASVTRPEPKRGPKGGSFMSRMSSNSGLTGPRPSRMSKLVTSSGPGRQSKLDTQVLTKQQINDIVANPKVRSAAEAGVMAAVVLGKLSTGGRHASVYTRSGVANTAALSRAAGAAALAYVQANGGSDEDAAAAMATAAVAASSVKGGGGKMGGGSFMPMRGGGGGIAEEVPEESIPPPPAPDNDDTYSPGPLQTVQSGVKLDMVGEDTYHEHHDADVLFDSLQAAPEGKGKRKGGGKRLSTTPLRVSLTRSAVTEAKAQGGDKVAFGKQVSKMNLSGGKGGIKKGFLMKVRIFTSCASVDAVLTTVLVACSLVTCLAGWWEEHVR
jgi:hypothetical protein